jgi:hypothetical protein
MIDGDAVFKFRFTVSVVSIYEHFQHSPQGIKVSIEATASTGKTGNIVTQISVYALYNVCIPLVTYIADMSSGKNNVKITHVAVCRIIFSLRSVINNALQSACPFV